MKLIANWRQAWRLWSVRVPAIAATIFALLLAAPDFFASLWNALPPEIQGLIPNSKALALILAIASGVARIIQQRGGISAQDITDLVDRMTSAESALAGLSATVTHVNSNLAAAGIKIDPATGTVSLGRTGTEHVAGYAVRDAEPAITSAASGESGK